MGMKPRKRRRELPDPRMDMQKRRAHLRRILEDVDRRIGRAEAGSGTRGRLVRLRHQRQMLADEIARLEVALEVLARHGPAHQIRVPGSGERIRLYHRRKRR